jgi:hypothetical protein
MKNKNTLIYVVLAIVVIVVVVVLMSSKKTPTPTQTDTTDTSSTGTNTTGATGGTKTTGGYTTTGSTQYLRTTNVRLIYPKNGDSVQAGATITAQYEITSAVSYAKFTLLQNDCPFEITNGKVGVYTFTCLVPKTYIGSRQAVLSERIASATTAPVTKNSTGTIRVIPPMGVTVKSITHSPAGVVSIPLVVTTSTTRPYIALSALFSDGITRNISAADAKYTVADSSVASMSNFYSDSFAYVTGKKVGTTKITISYGGVSDVVTLEVVKK